MGVKINEISKLTGITVRALHYYDQIGLLAPKKQTETGYRIYDEKDLKMLQQILFFKELDFPLEEIKDIMQRPGYDEAQVLSKQRKLLVEKRERLDAIIGLVDKTLKGDKDMSFKQFDESKIEADRKKYAAEIKERWGNTKAYKECETKTAGYDAKEWGNMTEGLNSILKEFGEAHAKGEVPESKAAQELVAKWQKYITDNMYECTNEILLGLGKMYVADERFTANIDKNGDGTAKYISAAIEFYCNK